MKQQQQVNIKNKRASFDYELVERFTAGLVLYGTEIKTIGRNLHIAHPKFAI